MSTPEVGYAFPWEREAMRGDALPEGLELWDQMAYLSLRSLYRDYHEKRLDRETASAEKRRVFGAWEQAKRAAEFDRKLQDYHVRLIRGAERAVCRCRKEPTEANALYLCDVLDGFERPEVDTWS